MIRNWRAWVLLILLVGPILAYIGLGALWLKQHGWLLIAGVVWIASSIVFYVLAARWTRSTQPILPPLDWDAPRTFSPKDRQAWTLVEETAEQGDTVRGWRPSPRLTFTSARAGDWRGSSPTTIIRSPRIRSNTCRSSSS